MGRASIPIPLALVLLNVAASTVRGQDAVSPFSDPAVWRELEHEILAEVNRIRMRPDEYAEQFLVPLKETLVRIPQDESEPFEACQVTLDPAGPYDYLRIREEHEGKPDTERSLGLIDETIAALRASSPQPALSRDAVLDRAARFYSQDFLTGGKDRPAHVDSLGRKPVERIAAFGATRRALDDWQRLCDTLNDDCKTVLRVFREEETYFLAEYPDEDHCRYRSIPDSLGEFVVGHGEEARLPLLDKQGHECTVRIDPRTRRMTHGDDTLIYVLPPPLQGENVVWGKWSRQWAARGLVCWWVIDPGIPERGHRHTLLDPDFRFAGVGCAGAPEIGWVVTLDCCAEPLESLPRDGAAEDADEELKASEPLLAVKDVCAWPNLKILPDGTLVATIFNQPSHGSVAGDVECWASQDGGKTWQRRGIVAPHEPDTNRMNHAAGLAANGDLVVICSGWSNRYPAGQTGAPFRARVLPPWVCRSADGGRTWEIDKTAFPAAAPDDGWANIPFGDVLRGQDGALRVATYSVRNTDGGRMDRVWIYRSPDDGRSWGEPVAVHQEGSHNETALLHLGGGRWLAAARTHSRGTDGRRYHLSLFESDDDAHRWSLRGPVTDTSQHPGHLLRLSDGSVLLTYGNRTDDRGVDVRFSRDEGRTWSEPRRIAEFQGDGGYPSSVQRPDGRLVTAFYARATTACNGYQMAVVVWDSPIW